jgi:hypothetical protein
MSKKKLAKYPGGGSVPSKSSQQTSSKSKKQSTGYQDEMGNPRTKAQQKAWEKAELEMIDYKGRPKMKSGGSLKPVDSSKNPGLAKLPTAVRNNMGYKKSGGPVKMKMGGSCGTPKRLGRGK